MPAKAKVYISCVCIAALGVLAANAPQLVAVSAQFAMLLALTAVAAALKVPIPQMQGTISISYVFLLFGITQCGPAEAALLALCAAIVQSYWRPKLRPSIVQVAFNAAVLIVSAAIARWVCQEAIHGGNVQWQLAVLALGAFVFYTTDTLLVAAVLALVARRRLSAIWHNCHVWAFPYYLTGTILLDAVIAMDGQARLRAPLLVLPLMMLLHVFYRNLVGRFGESQTQSVVPSV